MSQPINRQWRLKNRPVGMIDENDFSWHEEAVRQPEKDEVLVRSVYLSLDPTNRIWITDMPQYMEPVQVGDVMRGIAIGVVETSEHANFAPGDIVSGMWGWQEYATLPAQQLTKIPSDLPVPLDAWTSVLGPTGMTAYFGLLDIGQPKQGETVIVSAAAGAVGSLVGQIAKIKGCRAVGLAGTDEKCNWLTNDLGFDAAVNYKTTELDKAIAEACPDGIDINFENVGGKILDTILTQINMRARIVLCGLIANYNSDEPVPGPYHFAQILMQRARLEGFIILDYIPQFPHAIAEMATWLAEGKLKYKVDVVKGLKEAPTAVNYLFTGRNIGKLVVQVSDLPK
ncbi:NADP-dependent oxidoreductase [Acanthopleuribacter pedis]|uniref:NADP-dependent oxidoreductase n=1 Tax=Acanthopleuribacter pedis TaxID=442870 RepID=A0A8J7U6Q8_9BACT|nr:NADP-dependent oxidoreductase [Acanthopleuribacter pedis]MBO1321688.1 NADP-dependent oxidoreductase [Acanthopleuribacter pedis]